MSESVQHIRLVQAILAYVRREFANLTALAIFDDTAEPTRGEKPPRIYGYVPDVYAVNVPPTTTIIGEAKTRSDLETQRSRAQIAGFLDFLSVKANGVFILAVPFSAAATARTVVTTAQRGLRPSETRVVILDGIVP